MGAKDYPPAPALINYPVRIIVNIMRRKAVGTVLVLVMLISVGVGIHSAQAGGSSSDVIGLQELYRQVEQTEDEIAHLLQEVEAAKKTGDYKRLRFLQGTLQRMFYRLNNLRRSLGGTPWRVEIPSRASV